MDGMGDVHLSFTKQNFFLEWIRCDVCRFSLNFGRERFGAGGIKKPFIIIGS